MTQTDPNATIIVTNRGGVRQITFDRPDRKNAFNDIMYRAVAEQLQTAVSDDTVRVIVLTGQGDTFCAGQDLNEMQPVQTDEPIGFDKMLSALIACDKPIIAAVNGMAIGIGVTMLLHVDITLVARGARLKCPFVPLGVVPEAASSFLLPQVIGYQRAMDYLLSARWLDSSEAVALGLAVQELAPDQLLQTATERANAIAALPPAAVRHTKRLLKASAVDAVNLAREREAEAFLERLGTPENQEAIAAFFEKREPDFSQL